MLWQLHENSKSAQKPCCINFNLFYFYFHILNSFYVASSTLYPHSPQRTQSLLFLVSGFAYNPTISVYSGSQFDDDSHVIVEEVGDNDRLPGYRTVPGRRGSKPRKSRDVAPEMRTWKTNSSFYWAIVKSFGGYYALIGIFEIFNIILTFIRPLIQE